MGNNFSKLAVEYANAIDDDRLYIIAQALTINNIRQIVSSHKDGWNGVEGKFARVISQILYQGIY